MSKRKVFISYSHEDTKYLNELVTALQAVQGSKDAVWFDVQNIEIGDKFHDKIQQALPESSAAILLLSNHFSASGASPSWGRGAFPGRNYRIVGSPTPIGDGADD